MIFIANFLFSTWIQSDWSGNLWQPRRYSKSFKGQFHGNYPSSAQICYSSSSHSFSRPL